MILSKIIDNIGTVEVKGDVRKEIASITSDSRKVEKGGLFIAVKGYASDGHAYIASAIEKGAIAVIYEEEGAACDAEGVTFIKVENSRHAVAIAAHNFFGKPSEKLTLVGITGTNGKTTTVTLLYNLFMGLGYNCGLLSTIANYVGTDKRETDNTTSDPITINSLLAEMVEEGVTGYHIDADKLELMAQRIEEIMTDRNLYERLARSALKASRQYGADKTVEQIAHILTREK